MDASGRGSNAARATLWPGLPWWALWLLVWSAGELWRLTFERLAGAAAALGSGTAPLVGAGRAALVGVAVQFAMTAAETALYRVWWWRRRHDLPYFRTSVMLLQISLFECLALRLIPAAGASAEWWRVSLAGPRAAWIAGAPNGLAFAFGGLGLLAVARLALTADAQARGAHVPHRSAIAVTLGAWLATRLTQACAFDLARGRSPLG